MLSWYQFMNQQVLSLVWKLILTVYIPYVIHVPIRPLKHKDQRKSKPNSKGFESIDCLMIAWHALDDIRITWNDEA